MKIALLSDIHGNLFALKECIKTLEKMNIDGIIWCGDYVTDIPLSHDTLKYIREINKQYKNWIIKGNREDYILNYHYKKNKNWTMYGNTSSLLLTYQSLTQEDIDYIESLPDELYVDIPGAPKIYLSHKPNRNVTCKYAIFGHVHKQYAFKNETTTFFSPGSVGLSNSGIPGAEYMIIDLKKGEWIAKKYRQSYDLSKPINCIRNSELNNVSIKWGEVLIKTLETGIDYSGNYVSIARKMAVEHGYSQQLEEIPDYIWEMARIKLGINIPNLIPLSEIGITLKIDGSLKEINDLLINQGFSILSKSQIFDNYYMMNKNNKAIIKVRKKTDLALGKTEFYCSSKTLLKDNTNDYYIVKIDDYNAMNNILNIIGLNKVLETSKVENVYCKKDCIIKIQDINGFGLLVKYNNNGCDYKDKTKKLIADLESFGLSIRYEQNVSKFDELLNYN